MSRGNAHGRDPGLLSGPRRHLPDRGQTVTSLRSATSAARAGEWRLRSTDALRRDHGPAVEYDDGSWEWRQYGVLDRDGGPAVFLSEAREEWIDPSGLAWGHADETELWFGAGRLHGDDGPAVVERGRRSPVIRGEHYYRDGKLDREDGKLAPSIRTRGKCYNDLIVESEPTGDVDPTNGVTGHADPSPVRFAVLSDPHAVADDPFRGETWAQKLTRNDPARNPFAAVKQLIEEESLMADALLCPGDLANRIDTAGLEYAWEELLAIGKQLGVERTIATAGNHDVIRAEDLPDGAEPGTWIEPLRRLRPVFPSENSEESEVYFADDFVLVEAERWRVVALNSCARHVEPDEYKHGKVDDKTLAELETVIPGTRKDVNVFLCHHHPIEWPHLPGNDTSHMRGGNRLLSFLETRDPYRWVFLHGHRHVPALGYTGQTSSGAVRFSAGSLARSLSQEERSHVRNQFYVLEFDTAELKGLDLTMGGRFRSWDWNYTTRMQPALDGYGLPRDGGFGFRRDGRELATAARQQAEALGQRSVTWDELVSANRRWHYVAPVDRAAMRSALEEDLGANVEPKTGGSVITKVGFRA